MNYLIDKGKKFTFALKSNRFVALSEADWQQGQQRPMSELEWEETTLHRVWLAGVKNALVLARQTFLNKEGSRGELYLISNDFGRCAVGASAAHVEETYALRWKVEEFHKSIKSNTGYAHPPAHRVRRQSNHSFLSMRGRPCGGLCKVGSGKSSYSIKSFCIEGQIDLKCVKNSVGAMEGLQTSLFYTCSICVTSVIQQESIDIAFIDV